MFSYSNVRTLLTTNLKRKSPDSATKVGTANAMVGSTKPRVNLKKVALGPLSHQPHANDQQYDQGRGRRRYWMYSTLDTAFRLSGNTVFVR